MELGLRGKKVLITGGTRGIGRAIALAFAAAGSTVTACYHQDEASAADTEAELAGVGGTHRVVRADVTDESEVAALVGAGRWDVVIGNVGVDGRCAVADMPPAEWDRLLDTNLTGMHLLARAAAPALGPGGSLVLIGGAVAARGAPGMAHHTAGKAGIVGLVRSLAREFGPRGVRVNVVAPGIVDTDPLAGPPAPVRNRLAAATALGRLGEPEDVAGVVLFLASDLAGYLTGADIAVDGGI